MPVKTAWPDFFSSPNFESWQQLNCSRTLQSRFQREVQEMHEYALAENLVQPRLAYVAQPITDKGDDWIRFENGDEITEAAEVASKFTAADELILAVGTIGDGLETAAAEMFKNKKAIKGLALEEVAVAAIFEFTNVVLAAIDEFAATRGLQASSPIYPGHGEFSMAQQRRVFVCRSSAQLCLAPALTSVKSPSMAVPWP